MEDSSSIINFSSSVCPPAFSLDNFNFSDFDYPINITRPFTWKECVKVLAYVIVFLLALLGNVLVILIVYFNQNMRSTTNFYLVNLAVADVMIAVCCMWVHLLKNISDSAIMLGAFMCKVDPFIQMTSLTASVLTLTAISGDRFIAVIFPLRARLTQQRARVVIVTVWFLAVAVSSPFLYHRKSYEVRWKNYTEMQCTEAWVAETFWDPERQGCVISYPAKEIYYTFFVVALFFVPVTVMTVTYSLIVWRLWVSQLPGEHTDSAVLKQARSKKKVVKMVLIVLLVFLLCWTPLQILILYAVFGHVQQEHGDLPEWFEDVQYAAYFIAYSNSAANPVIYCGFNANFRQGLFGILRCSLIQDFRVRTQRGKSSTVTTHIGSGKLRDAPTGMTAATHELSEFNPPIIVVQKPEGTCIIANNQTCDGYKSRRHNSGGDYEEVLLKNHSTQLGNYI